MKVLLAEDVQLVSGGFGINVPQIVAAASIMTGAAVGSGIGTVVAGPIGSVIGAGVGSGVGIVVAQAFSSSTQPQIQATL